MATMNVSLPDGMKKWVEAQAKTGGFSNVSDYVCALIRRYQEEAAAHAELQRLVDMGLEGRVSNRTIADIWKEAEERNAGRRV